MEPTTNRTSTEHRVVDDTIQNESTHAANMTLGDPDRLPPKAVYDSQCGVCSSIHQWAEQRLRHEVDFVPVQDDKLRCEVPNIDRERLRYQFAFQEPDGNIYYGGEGAARLLARLKQPWSFFGRLGMVPPFRQLSRPLYRLVSKNRPKLAKGAGVLGHYPQPEQWPDR